MDICKAYNQMESARSRSSTVVPHEYVDALKDSCSLVLSHRPLLLRDVKEIRKKSDKSLRPRG